MSNGGANGWSQSELDKFIANNDWNAVSNFISTMRESDVNKVTAQKPVPSPAAGIKVNSNSRTLDTTSNGNSIVRMPRKRFGARSQLQYNTEDELSDVSSYGSGSYSDGSMNDWESFTSGPSSNRGSTRNKTASSRYNQGPSMRKQGPSQQRKGRSHSTYSTDWTNDSPRSRQSRSPQRMMKQDTRRMQV